MERVLGNSQQSFSFQYFPEPEEMCEWLYSFAYFYLHGQQQIITYSQQRSEERKKYTRIRYKYSYIIRRRKTWLRFAKKNVGEKCE